LDEIIRELEYSHKLCEINIGLQSTRKHDVGKNTKQKEHFELKAVLYKLHGIGTNKIRCEPVSQKELCEELDWPQAKVSREMRKLFGKDPMREYKRCFVRGKLVGIMKKLEDGSFQVDGIEESEQE